MNTGRIIGVGVLVGLLGMESVAFADLVDPGGSGAPGAGGTTVSVAGSGTATGGVATSGGGSSVAGGTQAEEDDSDDGGCALVPSSPSSPVVLGVLGLAVAVTLLRRKRV